MERRKFVYIEHIDMLMIKKVGGFIVNRLIFLIPTLVISIMLLEYARDIGLMQIMENSSGFVWVELAIRQIAFWASGIMIILELFSNNMGAVVYQFFSFCFVFFSFTMFDTLTALIFRNDLGSLPFQLIIVDKHGNRALRWQIVLRTFLKYLTVFLCPILLLFPLFNRRNACLHELISGAYKVEKPKPVYPPMYYPPQQQ